MAILLKLFCVLHLVLFFCFLESQTLYTGPKAESVSNKMINPSSALDVHRDPSPPQLPTVRRRLCFKEVPGIFLYERHFQEPEGNGSSIHFVKLNVCCDGYKPYEHNKTKCVPDCGKKCRNGVCLQPGYCSCYPGFAKNLDGECVQTCPQGCLNGKCHSNGSCVCEEGFQLDSQGAMCLPVCTQGCRSNQNCTYPEHCDCLKGYQMNSMGKCEFVCERICGHGKCIGPNVCECNEGYQLREGICQANCTQKCGNGVCVDTNRCVCDSGYTYDYHTTHCLPKCKKCVNGVCIAPGCCKCYKDFSKVKGICTHNKKIRD